METADIIILICFLPAIWLGLKNGFVRQLTSILVVIFGIRLSMRFSTDVAKWLCEATEISEFWAKMASFIVIFFVVALVLGLIGKLLEKIINISLLGWLDKLLGLLLSLALFAIVISAVIYLLDIVNTRLGIVSADKIAESRFIPHLLDLANYIFSNFWEA